MSPRKEDYMRGYGEGIKDARGIAILPNEAMIKAVSGFPVSGPYLSADEAFDIWSAMDAARLRTMAAA